jgi:hypothetical protein
MVKVRNKKYLEQVLSTGKDPKNILKVDEMKVKTYCVRVDVPGGWSAWKTHGRAWQKPEAAPLALRQYMTETMHLQNVRQHDGYILGEVSVASPYTKMAMFNRIRAAAQAALDEMGKAA